MMMPTGSSKPEGSSASVLRGPARPIGGGRRSTFVGRSGELSSMVDALPGNAASGGRLWMVAGEAGIGKTRLVRELVDRAFADGHRIFWGQCWDEAGAPPYWPWTQVIRQVQGVRTGVDLASLVIDGSDDVDRFTLFDAVVEELRRAAKEDPVLVVLDDLHRSDPSTLFLARFVRDHLDDAPVMVVATVRPEEAAARADIADHIQALTADAHVLQLTGLGVDEVAELVGDRAAAADVQAITAGNPLFVDQVLRAGGDRTPSSLEPGGDGAHRAALLAALEERIRHVDPDTTGLLAALAVLGPSAGARSTAMLLGSTTGAVLPTLARARSAGLVDPDGWTLSHPLVAEAVVGLLPGSRLEALHLSASRLGDDGEGSAAERAHHLCRAGPDHWKEAVDACCEAARVATASYAHDDAVAHYERAAALVAAHPEATALAFEVEFARAGALERTAGRLPAEDAYRRAVDLARRTGDPEVVARAAARHGITFYTDGAAHLERAAECRGALAGLPDGDSALLVRLLANLAASDLADPDSIGLADRAVAIGRRVGDPEALGIALVAQQVANLGPSALRRRLRTSREVIALAEQCGERDLAVRGRFLLTNALLESGDVRQLDAELVAQDRLVNEIAEPRFARHTLWFQCMRAMFDGRPDEVERLAELCLEIAQQLQDPDGYGVYTGQLGVARWFQGRLMELEPVYLDLMRAQPDEPLWPAVVGWLWLGDGRLEAARGALDRLPPPTEVPEGMHTLLTLFTMADLVAAVGDDDLVDQMWEVLLPYADRAVPIAMGAACFGLVARPLGLLSLRRGRIDEGIAHLEGAIAVAGRMGAQPWLVDAQLALADALLDHGRADDPRLPRLSAEVKATNERLGLAVFAQRIADLGRRVGRPGDPGSGRAATAGDPEPTAGPRASVSVLGAFEVVGIDGTPARWTSRKARSLLKILVARRGVPVAREPLMEMLWPGEDPASLGNRLAVAVSTVRRALDPTRSLPADSLVRADGGALSLSYETVDVDVERFLRSGADALDAHRRGDPDALERLHHVLVAYRGDALPDEPYAEWAEALRSATSGVYAAVLRATADLATAAEDHLTASDALRRLVDLDRFDESAHLRLVESLLALGARGQARAAYERYERDMGELGVPLVQEPTRDAGG